MPATDQVRDDGCGIPVIKILQSKWFAGQARNDKNRNRRSFAKYDTASDQWGHLARFALLDWRAGLAG